MKRHQICSAALVVCTLAGLTGCAGMSKRDQSMVIGAGAGGVAGAVLTGGSPWGVTGGAAVGAVIGNEIARGR